MHNSTQINDTAGSNRGLIICRSNELALAIRKILSSLGAANELNACSGPDEALQAALKDRPRFVLLNWSDSPLEQNSLFLQLFRKKTGYKSIPILLLADSLNRALLACATEYQAAKILNLSRLENTLGPILLEVEGNLKKPSNALSYLSRITVAAEKNAVGEIQQLAQDFFNLFPSDPRAQLEYANVCLQKGEWTKASQLARKVLLKNKDDLRATNILARSFLFERKFGDALLILEEAETLSPRNLDRLVLLGEIYRKVGDPQTARGHYSGALRVDPHSREAKIGLGQVELSQGEINEALKLFQNAATEDELGGFFNNAAIYAVSKGAFEKAMALYESAQKALQQHHLKAKVSFNQGLAYKKWQRNDEAIACFKKALQLSPHYLKAKAQLAKFNIVIHESAAPPIPSEALEQGKWQDLTPLQETLATQALTTQAMTHSTTSPILNSVDDKTISPFQVKVIQSSDVPTKNDLVDDSFFTPEQQTEQVLEQGHEHDAEDDLPA